MSLTGRGTLIPPVGGITGAGSAANLDHLAGQPRKPRCRVTDRLRNPCPNEALTDLGVCMRHMREIAGEWARLVRDAADMFPGLARILDEALEDDAP